MSAQPEDIHGNTVYGGLRPARRGSVRPARGAPVRGASPLAANRMTSRQVTVGHQRLRVDVRTGDGTGTPLLMCCGIGTSFELLQSLVDALDPGIDIIRFDAPGV